MSAPLVMRMARNTAGRDLIVGDVHGCFTKLRAALAEVGFDRERDRLFMLGDMVGRGPESEQVLEWLHQPWCFAIAGNHEAMNLDYFDDGANAGMLIANGEGWFVAMTAAEKLPYVDAFRALPVAIELETPAGLLGLVHAECPMPEWGQFIARLEMGGLAARTAVSAAQWSRHRIDYGIPDDVAGVLAVLVGHTPVERLTSLGNVLYCDTGAWLQRGASPRRFCIVDAATLRPAVGPSLLDWGSHAPI